MTNPSPSAPSPITRPDVPRGFRRWIPGLAILKTSTISSLARDTLAGLVLTAILIPAGMGYAEAAGLPAVCGLYASIVPLLAYAVFGPSRILILGPDSSLAALIAATILPLSAEHPERLIPLAGLLAMLSGALCLLAGLLRLGFVTDLISRPIRSGYLNGIALTVILGQLPTALGFRVTGENALQRGLGLVQGIWQGRVQWVACLLSAACLLLILCCRRWSPRVPGVLLAVAGATIVSSVLDLAGGWGLSVVGALPAGLPTLQLPAASLAELQAIGSGAVAIMLVAFADMSVLSRTYAQRGGYQVDSNQELVALGIANIAAGLFHGFAVSSSSSRTPVAEAAGARTQFAGVVGAVCMALVLIQAPGLLRSLPHAALSVVVIAACLNLLEIDAVVRLYRLRRSELAWSLVCLAGVIGVGVVEGIFIAVALALGALIWRAWRPYDAVLGRVDGLKGYHDISRHPEARRIPGLVLFRWDAPLFFANAGIFQEHVQRAVASAPTPTRWVVVAAEPVTDIDITAADMLAELDRWLHQAGMDLCFAELKGPVKDHLKRYGLFATIGSENFFPTIGQAVDRYLAVHGVPWRDWDEAL